MTVKMAVIGLDGATFDVLNPLMKKGELPVLKKIIENGTYGNLESTFNPITGPAWTSLATGKNPGKTGVFDFFNRSSRNSFHLERASSTSIQKAGAYWDYLGDAGIEVGILNYPMLYPPYRVNGFMVSGLGSSPEDDITYPQDLQQTLMDTCDGYRIDIPFNQPQYINNPSLFVQETMELLEINRKSIKFLLRLNPDVFTLVISATDFAQHYMWKYIDSTHPLYSPEESSKYEPAFVDIWKEVDKILALILNTVARETNILIVSDHGFGPHRQTFFTNTWLRDKGYLHWKNQLGANLRGLVYDKIKKLSPKLRSKLMDLSTRYSPPITDRIDMRRTKAFANMTSGGLGEICINTSKQSPLKNADDYRITSNQVIQDLKDTCVNLGINAQVFLRENVYSGQYADLASDILFVLDDFECEAVCRPGRTIYEELPPSNHSGKHKQNGVFIGYGPDIKKNIDLGSVSICDIAPTILHMSGLPVPDDMDGNVLSEIFRATSAISARPVSYQKTNDEKKIRNKVRDLKRLGTI